jgi:hypothetical protein
VRQYVASPRLRLVGTARQGQSATFLAQGLAPGSTATFANGYLPRAKVDRVAEEYCEIHLSVASPLSAAVGPAVITMVAHDPVDVESVLFQIRRATR